MADQNSTTIKGGAGFDVPWIVVTGTATDQRDHIAEAFGISAEGKTLAEIAVEASLTFHALVNAATIGKPTTPKAATNESKPAKKAATKKTSSIADKAKGPSGQTATTDPIMDAIKAATTEDALKEVYKHNKANWTTEHTKAATETKAGFTK